jgi:hypothetical protein
LFLNSDNQIAEWLSNEEMITKYIKSSQQTVLNAHQINAKLLLGSSSNIPEITQPYRDQTEQLSLF